jgi:hypothetical protein
MRHDPRPDEVAVFLERLDRRSIDNPSLSAHDTPAG